MDVLNLIILGLVGLIRAFGLTRLIDQLLVFADSK